MNILIVDDEAFSVEGIKSNINWEVLGIEQVFTAFSMKQAQDIFLARHGAVDLMVCDIEMPKGSGIDLMTWVRGKGYGTVCIFLTCYSQFEYTSRAIQLQIFEYLLKPIAYGALSDTIERAILRAQSNLEANRQKQYAEYWNDEQKHIQREFWTQLISGNIPASPDRIRHYLEIRHLPPELLDMRYHLFLVRAAPTKEYKSWEKGMFDYALTNILSELLPVTAIFPHGRLSYFMAVNPLVYPFDQFREKCRIALDSLVQTLPAEFFLYYTEPYTLFEVQAQYEELKNNSKQVLSAKSMLYKTGDIYTRRELPEVDEKAWQDALLRGDTEPVAKDIKHFLFGQSGIIERSFINILYHQLIGVLYFSLDALQIPTYQLFSEDTEYKENEFQTVQDFDIWSAEILNKAAVLFSSSDSSQSIIRSIKSYIMNNLCEDLSRNVLADMVHLNPDYLSYLFKEKCGYSLSEFIAKERLNLAKSLLLSTDFSIAEIAMRTGFQNIPYFSKQFKKLTGISPIQFRKQKGTV